MHHDGMNNLSCEDFLDLLPANDPGGREWHCGPTKVYVRRSTLDPQAFVIMDAENKSLGVMFKKDNLWYSAHMNIMHSQPASREGVTSSPHCCTSQSAYTAIADIIRSTTNNLGTTIHFTSNAGSFTINGPSLFETYSVPSWNGGYVYG